MIISIFSLLLLSTTLIHNNKMLNINVLNDSENLYYDYLFQSKEYDDFNLTLIYNNNNNNLFINNSIITFRYKCNKDKA